MPSRIEGSFASRCDGNANNHGPGMGGDAGATAANDYYFNAALR